MIEFDFVPRSDDRSWMERSPNVLASPEMPADLRSLTADDFTFRYFRVNVLLRINGVDFSIMTPGLPLMDFILMLKQAVWEIDAAGQGAVETSQTQHAIDFVAVDDLIRIRASFSSGEVEVTRLEFDNFVERATKKALELLFNSHSELKQNQYLASLKRSGARDGDISS